jgi:sulfoacetaldehyde dehydrogenase
MMKLARSSFGLQTSIHRRVSSHLFSSQHKPTKPEEDHSDEIAGLVARSRIAQAQISDYTQAQVDDLITAMVWSIAQENTAKVLFALFIRFLRQNLINDIFLQMIAQHTIDETRLGNYDGKYLKIFRKTRCALMDIIGNFENCL